MRIVVVTPTYNERQNVGRLIEELEAAFERIEHDVHILVVDDSSPDGTAQAVRQCMVTRPNVHLLTGPKRGLGVAYTRGLTYALDQLGADAVVQLDADFSHNPSDVPRLVAALEGGADFVIGSRYAPGGRTLANWGVVRRAVSLSANLGARVIAGLYGIRDCTTGFRAIRGSILRRIELGDAAPRGYVILLYLIYQAMGLGARLQEVPVTFSNRTRGQSKLRFSDALEFFLNVWWIRYDRRETFNRLASGGLSGVAANLGTLALLHGLLGVPGAAAAALALQVAIVYSFVWSRLWMVAVGRALTPEALRRLAAFHLISLPSFLLTFTTFLALTSIWNVHFLAAQALGILPALFWNYFLGERVLELLWARLRVWVSGLRKAWSRFNGWARAPFLQR